MPISDYLKKKILDHVHNVSAYTAPSTIYLAAFTVAPTSAGGGTEVSTSGTGYARQAVTWGSATGTSTAQGLSNSAVNFAVATGNYGTVVAYATMDASSNGNFLEVFLVDSNSSAISVTINTNDQLQIASGSLKSTLT